VFKNAHSTLSANLFQLIWIVILVQIHFLPDISLFHKEI